LALSIREQILRVVEALLGAAGKPAGLTVHRQRTRPIEGDTLPAILFYAADDDLISVGGADDSPLVERHMNLRVECRAVGTEITPPDAALDPLYVWAVGQLVGKGRLGGLASRVVEGRTEWYSKEGDVAVAAEAIIFTVKYRTARADPTSTT
jgi:hypothetical protein